MEKDIIIAGYLAGYIEKEAGTTSEMMGNLNPLNIVGTPLGLIASMMTPTRTKEKQNKAEEDKWTNVLVPGVAGYNMGKRMGRLEHSQESMDNFSHGSMTAWDKLPYKEWLVKNRIKQISGEDYSESKMKKRVKATLKILEARQVDKPGVLADFGKRLLGGAVGHAQEFPLDWAKKNPKKAAQLRKLMTQDMSPEYKKHRSTLPK